MSDTPTLHLGIAMAGAVSAGAYTAGVMDYLFEALQKWEEAKKAEAHLPMSERKIPPHRVQIDVVGGASAGGITAALTALTCFSGLKPVSHPDQVDDKGEKPENNLFFDTWVNLAGKKNMPETILRMLESNDLENAQGVPSLLNSVPIDEVSAQAIEHVDKLPDGQWPSFIAQDLEILLTLCSLRGIPVGIDFNSGNSTWSASPSHQMAIHKQYARFTTGKNIKDNDRAMFVSANNPTALEKMMECAKATAAFPIGLQSREITLNRNHVKYQYGTFFDLDKGTLNNIFESNSESVPDPFVFTAVDGGALNNEPFAEIAEIMKERKRGDEDFAMILVDPFPNFNSKQTKYEPQKYLKALIPSILGALRNQGMLKEGDLHKMSSGAGAKATYKRNMIFPVRWMSDAKTGKWKKQQNPIACGGLDGFSGLLSREFRVHDFFLGRQNCRNFLHSYFTIEYDTKIKIGDEHHPIFKDWTKAMLERYKVSWRDGEGKIHLPIIPVLDFIEEEDKIEAKLVGKSAEERREALIKFARAVPCQFPSINERQVDTLKKPIKKRLFAMARTITNRISVKWIKWGLRAGLSVVVLPLLGYLTNHIIAIVKKDLAQNDLLKSSKARSPKS